jgi:alkaline phosphatase
MIDGPLSGQWTFLQQNNNTLAEDFYNGIGDLDPDNDDHLMVCVGGDYSTSKEENMPYRGVDSTFQNRHCSKGEAIKDPDNDLTVGVNITSK